MYNAESFKPVVKSFLRMGQNTDMYDTELLSLINSALATLTAANIKVTSNPLITDFICSYVRTRMLQDASKAFKESELLRERVLLNQLTFGGNDES